jgi:hypothetical protein
MAETTRAAEEATVPDALVAAHREAESHAVDTILPDADLQIEPGERHALVIEFQRVRDAHRGRFVADLRDLPGDPVRVATALARAAEEAAPADRRHLLEDLVDLQAFIADPPPVVLPAAPGTASDPAVDELLERIRWRQATVTSILMGHPSILGDHNAIRGRWTPIGDARAAIDLVNAYRERQSLGIGAMAIYPVAAFVGFVAASVLAHGRPSIVGLAVLGLGWLLAPWLGTKAGAVEAWVQRHPWRGAPLAIAVELVTGIGTVFALPFIFGVVAAIAGALLGLP